MESLPRQPSMLPITGDSNRKRKPPDRARGSHLKQTTRYGALYEQLTLSYSVNGRRFTGAEMFTSMFTAGAR